MPQYWYRAIDTESRVSTGYLLADSPEALERRVTELGLWLIEAKEKAKRNLRENKVKVTRKDLVDFFSGLATLIDAGIDIAESLRVLVRETPDDGLRRVLEELRLNIEGGVSFFEAMSTHPEVFSIEVCNLIHAGEQSGQLVETCQDIARHLEWVDELMADIKQATMYPSMVALAVLGLVFVMFSFVVPQFSVIFDSLNLELPALTVAVVTVGAFFDAYWWAVLIGAAGLVFLVVRGPRYSPSFALFLDGLKLNMPAFGAVNRLLVLSSFSHNLALMLKAGVPIVDSLRLVGAVLPNLHMVRAVRDAEKAVTEGRKMSEALAEHEIVSPLIMRMIVVGEETGKLDTCLKKISERMDDEIPRRIKRLFGVLEPAIIMVLLMIVGVVAGAIFLPLFSLMSGLGG